MTAVCFTHPIDTIKVHLQTSRTPARALSAARRIVQEAGILGLYAGLSAALLRQGTYTMARFATYDLVKSQLSGTSQPTLATLSLAALLSGAAGGLIGNPAEILNVRMQNDRALPTHMRRNYRNALQGLSVMLREEGVRSLAIGVGPSVLRATMASASQFVSYDLFKRRMLDAGLPDSTAVHFAASFAAGLVATTVCSPADVVKSRTMAALRRSHVPAVTPSVWATCSTIYRTEGPRAFFKGWLPSYVRLCPQLVITFVIYEKLRKSYFARYK
ncbi:Mitochondrial dicarboxylate transporter [Coemansia sp. RSA 2703]|nr:Mitochondrial dicarboxylate transporter [Coemansia sp. RSA 2703]KAJ2377592.1 Mitochondrial dicarboxylate transporter [Coemansia sp. RSA 2607]KAJ2398165.1 Mitochondrial dicarboxylate transporter [Coemansia sp. RSA 2603]